MNWTYQIAKVAEIGKRRPIVLEQHPAHVLAKKSHSKPSKHRKKHHHKRRSVSPVYEYEYEHPRTPKTPVVAKRELTEWDTPPEEEEEERVRKQWKQACKENFKHRRAKDFADFIFQASM